jgi:Holliday junction resolvase RusA-like endonuclease
MSLETTSIKFTIPMIPVPKARARTVICGGNVHSFTPKATRDAEDFIRAFVSGYPTFAAGVPLAMSIDFYLSRPRSISKKREFPTTRPDIDNYIKLIFDALDGVLFSNDSQIIRLLARKQYGEPRIELEITEII